jgi:predicted SprT family Zn-dependent metalloprotease
MPLLRQLEFAFIIRDALTSVLYLREKRTTKPLGEGHLPGSSGNTDLESKARELLRQIGADKLARDIRVEWNSRLKTAAGRADYRSKLISLNPELVRHPAEIDRTLRHELAHVLAQFRAGRRRILPHGAEWRQACHDLGIADEKRCHNLPFPVSERIRRYLYKCPNCQRDFPRVRRIKRPVACLACCRAHNGGDFDARFRLMLVDRDLRARCQADAPTAANLANELSDSRE